MTLTESILDFSPAAPEPPEASGQPQLPDDDAPSLAERRAAHLVKVGWHVRVDGRWLLVARVDQHAGNMALGFDGSATLTVGRRSMLWTRNPAEQIAYIASVLPARDHYRPPRSERMATLFGGSARSPLVD